MGLGLNFSLTLTIFRNTTVSPSIRLSPSAPESKYTVSTSWTVREIEIPPGLNDVCVVCVRLLCHNPAPPYSRGECCIFQKLFTSVSCRWMYWSEGLSIRQSPVVTPAGLQDEGQFIIDEYFIWESSCLALWIDSMWMCRKRIQIFDFWRTQTIFSLQLLKQQHFYFY